MKNRIKYIVLSGILFLLTIPITAGAGDENLDFVSEDKTVSVHKRQSLKKEHYNDYSLPETLLLCGEEIPLGDPRVWEMLDREFTIAVYDKAQVFMWLKRAGRYFPYIEEKLAEAGMPDDLKYLAVAESALNTYIRSSAGAVGPWQFMSRTARNNGLRKNRMTDERRNFQMSTRAALEYLTLLNGKFGSWILAMAAYNCGESRIRKEIKKQQVDDYFRLDLPLETERYIFRIAAIKIIMGNPKRYGYHLSPRNRYTPLQYDTIQVIIRRPVHITKLAVAAGTDFKAIKQLNPQFLGYHMPSGQYPVNVPEGLGERFASVIGQMSQYASYTAGSKTDRHHVVRPGDTLIDISKETGVPVSAIKRVNGIEGSLIVVGQKLLLNY